MATMLALRMDRCCLRHELCIGEDGESGSVPYGYGAGRACCRRATMTFSQDYRCQLDQLRRAKHSCTIQTIFSLCITATWIFSRALESTGQAQAIHPCTFRSHSLPLANSGPTPLAEEQRQKRQRAEEGFSCTCIDLTCCNTLPTVSSASQRTNCTTRKVCTMSCEYHAFLSL